jgi:hypothetical protein
MEHAEETDLCAKVPGIASDLKQSLSAGLKQQVINYLLVLPRMNHAAYQHGPETTLTHDCGSVVEGREVVFLKDAPQWHAELSSNTPSGFRKNHAAEWLNRVPFTMDDLHKALAEHRQQQEMLGESDAQLRY